MRAQDLHGMVGLGSQDASMVDRGANRHSIGAYARHEGLLRVHLRQRSSSIVLVAEDCILQPDNGSAQTPFERQLVGRRQRLHRHAAGSVTLLDAAIRPSVLHSDLRDAVAG